MAAGSASRSSTRGPGRRSRCFRHEPLAYAGRPALDRRRRGHGLRRRATGRRRARRPLRPAPLAERIAGRPRPAASPGRRRSAAMRSRRARAIVFFAVAMLAAAVGGGDRRRLRVERRPRLRAAAPGRGDRRRHYGRAGRSGSREVTSALEVRRVPVRFVPPGALATPGDALGLVPRGRCRRLLPARRPAAPARRREPDVPGLLGDRRPVEIAVSGAEALLATGGRPAGARVDVVVTTEPAGAAAPDAPMSPPPRCRCSGSVPGPKARVRADVGGDAGADPAPGAAADRRRELRPPGDPDPGAVAVQARRAGRRGAGAALRARLVERRRAAAAAGRAARPTSRGGASAGRRGGGAARPRGPRGDRRPDRPRQRRARAARGSCSPTRRSRR